MEGHQNIAKLVIMHRDGSTELAALKVQYEYLRWPLGDVYLRESERKVA